MYAFVYRGLYREQYALPELGASPFLILHGLSSQYASLLIRVLLTFNRRYNKGHSTSMSYLLVEIIKEHEMPCRVRQLVS